MQSSGWFWATVVIWLAFAALALYAINWLLKLAAL